MCMQCDQKSGRQYAELVLEESFHIADMGLMMTNSYGYLDVTILGI